MCNGPQDDGKSVRDQTLKERCYFGVLQEDGQLAYRCQELTCATKNQGRRYLNLVPVLFYSGRWKWSTPGVQNVGLNTMVVFVRSDLSDRSKRNVAKRGAF